MRDKDRDATIDRFRISLVKRLAISSWLLSFPHSNARGVVRIRLHDGICYETGVWRGIKRKAVERRWTELLTRERLLHGYHSAATG